MSPLIRYPESTAVLAPRLFAPIKYYALMASCGHAIVQTDARYDKRHKGAHRYEIADVRGPLQLTVPISRPAMHGATWRDIAISDHGRWWAVHRATLETAYGRTPFFEFYIDRLLPLMQEQGSPGMPADVACLIERADSIVRDILKIETSVTYGPGCCPPTPLPEIQSPEYYQVRSASLGFIPDLSILDLIFNEGPESPLILEKYIRIMPNISSRPQSSTE